ncbi:hypothetical protein ACFVT6_05135 [Streptomyces sp. NPDC058049]|uniref:hypothetical protein n=1 Tax=Streptomyces sp. NPDC058049 TaxID=3346314 RepID=UPI0036E79797
MRGGGGGTAGGTGTGTAGGTGTGTAGGADSGRAGGPDRRGGPSLLGVDRPEVVLAAFRRGEPEAGAAAVTGLALDHTAPEAVLPVVARALDRPDTRSAGHQVSRTP